MLDALAMKYISNNTGPHNEFSIEQINHNHIRCYKIKGIRDEGILVSFESEIEPGDNRNHYFTLIESCQSKRNTGIGIYVKYNLNNNILQTYKGMWNERSCNGLGAHIFYNITLDNIRFFKLLFFSIHWRMVWRYWDVFFIFSGNIFSVF